jgi:hypothetical protein
MGLRDSIQEMALPLRDKLKKSAGPYLEPDEQIQAVFLAKRPEMQYNDRAVVATDRRILLLELGMRVSTVKCVLAEVSRETKLGPCHGVLIPSVFSVLTCMCFAASFEM